MQLLNNQWKLGLISNSKLKNGFYPMTALEVENSGNTVIPGSVPGNFELDMLKAGLIEDPYYGVNSLKLRDLEDLHLYYMTTFEYKRDENKDNFLVFEGIDTISEIYIDGCFFAFTENMFIPHEFNINDLEEGKHELIVHIIPTGVYAKQFTVPASLFACPYNFDSLNVRKAPYMWGWDIMARTVSGGIFKPCYIETRNKTRIEDFYLTTIGLYNSGKAELVSAISYTTDLDNVKPISYKIEGKCGDSTFSKTVNSFSVNDSKFIMVENPKLWWPKNSGEQNLYDVKVSLMIDGEVVDTKEIKFGIRIIQLSRTSLAGEDGDFCFVVNGKRIFTMGTNIVPFDSFPSRHKEYEKRCMDMVEDLGCNIVRWWGGNVYPDDSFYDFCDEKGILVWQDFAMACGWYPDTEQLRRLFTEEATYIVKKYRNRASLALWSGDNECDVIKMSWTTLNVYGKEFPMADPNDNVYTREILKRIIKEEDFARAYIPSSPYMDEVAFEQYPTSPAENHLWGPRDYFKGDFYGKSICHFASETGYHGCPSPQSLRKYIPEDHLHNYGDENGCDVIYWHAHASSMEPDVPGVMYSYRITLMAQQIKRIFNTIPDEINKFALQSQISQGEAKKFFIERFRINKGKKNGIIWWNLIDGWPQISDAIVDWYGVKKLAYYYVKNSQQPFCIMFDEPTDGILKVVAVNDLQKEVSVKYTIKNLLNNQVVLTGNTTVKANDSSVIALTPEVKDGFYLITWEGDENGKNHFTATIGDGINYENYVKFISELGIYQKREGFDS